ncbi:MAG: glycine cleavage system aminomethyltransferase GcvT [Bacteroidia bacterium]
MSDSQTLKLVPLNDVHIAAGGKMVPFAGFNMPVQYSGLLPEHHAVRNNVGIFDVSHMGEFRLKGPGVLDLLQRVTSNDVSKLTDGKVQYSCLPNDTGGIVDDLLVYRWTENEYYLVVNAGNIDKDWDWISKHNTGGVEMLNMSDGMSLLAVQGPNAIKVLQKLTDVNLSEMEYYTFKMGIMAGKADTIISNTGYTGAGGFEIYMKNDDAEHFWNAILEAGKEFGIIPAGLGARDTLRLEKGFCLYGHDINDETSPIEAGLGWITKFEKEFTNSAYHKAIKENKPTKKLVGFDLIERGIPRQYYKITDGKGNEIGEVTSGTQSPSLNKPIGMGYVKSDYSKPGSEIFIEIRGKELKAEVVKLPFL